MLDTSILRNNLPLTVGVIFGGIVTILIIRKISQRTSKNKCQVCSIPITLDNSSDYITCSSCDHTICRNRGCAIWKEQSKDWNCKLCCSFSNGSNSACDWLISQLNEKLLHGKGVDGQNKITWDKSNSNNNSPLIPLEQREKVREFVEELVSTLVGGSIDNAPVGQLYDSKDYISLFSNYHSRLSKKLYNLELSIRRVLFGLPNDESDGNSIDQSHTNLKHLVQRIIEEVFKIPDLFDHSGASNDSQRINLPHFDPKKYEELLATAVLNKLVESYSYERRFENSSGIHSGSDVESINTVYPKSHFEILSTSSSNEPGSDSSTAISLIEQPMSLTVTSYDILSPQPTKDSLIKSRNSDSVSSNEEAYLTDYIQKHRVSLPRMEIDDSNGFGDSDSFDDTDGNWQENWLFQKRKLRNETSTAIGMLVPSPMEEVKALIGDKTADEVSDLSEADSDFDDDGIESVIGGNSADLPHALIESKTVIGGKNDIGTFNEAKTIDELLQPDSLVSIQSVNYQNPTIMEAKNDMILISSSKPVIVELNKKENTSDISKSFSMDVTLQSESSQRSVPESTEKMFGEIEVPKDPEIENMEPPIPTPRKKSKSLDTAKEIVSVEAKFPHRIEGTNRLSIENQTFISQIVGLKTIEDNELLANKVQSKSPSLDDELLDSSINDIFESIEDVSIIDYQSLVGEDEAVPKGKISMPEDQQIILQASNPFIEDCLNETTQEIQQGPFTGNQFDTKLNLNESTSNVSKENYICKVSPNEFDLSGDNVFQSKADVVDDLLPRGIEDKIVPQAVYISSKPALIAVEIASHEPLLFETVSDQTASIPTLIISKSIGDTPPPIVNGDDYVSLKTKKVLKAQDSLELPADDRDKFEPVKRVSSFDMDNGNRNLNAKIGSLENIDNSVTACVKSDHNEPSLANVDFHKEVESDDNFVIVTEDEVENLIREEQEALKATEIKTDNDHEIMVLNSSEKSSDFNLNEHYRTYGKIQISTLTHTVKRLSSTHSFENDQTIIDDQCSTTSATPEAPSTLKLSESTVTSSIYKKPEISTPTRDSTSLLPVIDEIISQAETFQHSNSSNTNTSSKLFTTKQTFTLAPATNKLQLNEFGDLPGSIAEREHLKWKNAQDIPNNPYSVEALQRRLSQTKSPSKIIDINLALTKQIDDQNVQPEAEDGKPLKIVLGAGEPDHLRYGRDYYINDSKPEQRLPRKTLSLNRYSSTDEDNISTKVTTPDSDLYTAKIVQIKDDTDHTSDDSSILKLADNNSLSVQSDSLTLSDDSESTRVYDLRKNETLYLRSDIIRTSRIPIGATVTPPPTPIDDDVTLHKNLDQHLAIKQLNQLKNSVEEHQLASQIRPLTLAITSGSFKAKPLSPDAIKFLAPKPKAAFISKIKMDEVISIKSLVQERENPNIPQNDATEKMVIEEDVISSLPSVKALAKNFIENNSTETAVPPIQRPKSFTWQVSKDNESNKNGFVKEPSPDSFAPTYERTFIPVAPGHSITARSLSTKFREELKHSISDDTANGTDTIEIIERQRDHSPDRPPSPVLLKGIFKEKMSFFQNLETK